MRQAHWLRVLTVAALVCAGFAMYTWAQPDDYLAQLEEDGWEEVAASVYQRNLSDGTEGVRPRGARIRRVGHRQLRVSTAPSRP